MVLCSKPIDYERADKTETMKLQSMGKTKFVFFTLYTKAVESNRIKLAIISRVVI